MRRSNWILLLGISVSIFPAEAQHDTWQGELFAGYDYVRVDARDTSFNFNGGSGQLAYNVNNRLNIVGDLGGYYTNNGFGAGIFSYLFGPRVIIRARGRMMLFAQLLFGGARSIVASPQNAFAATAGGGIELRVSERFAIRPAQAEYFLTNFTDGASNRQNNFRYSGGIVFRFGTRSIIREN